MIINEHYYDYDELDNEYENDYDEENDDYDEDEESNEEFDCYFDIDCEDCGYYIDHEGTCPFQTGLFIN